MPRIWLLLARPHRHHQHGAGVLHERTAATHSKCPLLRSNAPSCTPPHADDAGLHRTPNSIDTEHGCGKLTTRASQLKSEFVAGGCV